MKRSHRFAVVLSLWIIVSMLLSNVAPALAWMGPAAGSSAKATGSPARSDTASLSATLPESPSQTTAKSNPRPAAAHMQSVPIAATAGRLLFAPTVDADGDPASNPVLSVPVPVIDLMGDRYGLVTLAAQLESANPKSVPVGVPVTFQLWNAQGVQFEQTERSDAWGAIQVEVPLDDLAGEYMYQASAPGYGETEVRHFRFDPGRVSYTIHPDGAHLWYQRQGPGQRLFTLRSPVPLRADRDEVTLIIVRRPTSDPITAQKDPLQPLFETVNEAGMGLPFPSVVMRIVGTYTATVQVQLPPGDYSFLGSLAVNDTPAEHFYSQLMQLMIEEQAAPPSGDAIWASSLTYDPNRTLVQYRAPTGQVVFDLAKTDQVPPVSDDWEGQNQFVKDWRTGPFEWHREVYDVQVETHVSDGKKLVALQNFDYDPNARRYTLAIKSLQAQTVTDTLRVDVLGPGGVVIRHEEVPVVLKAGQVLPYTIEVPAELGQPQGLRVVLDDPLIEIIQTIVAAAQTVYDAIRSGDGYFAYSVKLYAEALGVTIVEYKASVPGTSEFKWIGDLSAAELKWALLKWITGGAWEGSGGGYRRISLGKGGADHTLSAGVSFTVDQGKCPDPDAINGIQQSLKDLADSLNAWVGKLKIEPGKPIVTPLMPLWLFLKWWGQISPSFGGKVSAEGLSIRVTADSTLGGSFQVGFGLNTTKDFRSDIKLIYNIAVSIKGLASIIQAASAIKGWQVPQKKCDPDPPDPQPPDDRQDAWQSIEGFYQGQTYDATIDNLNKLIQQAQAQGLGRAERFLTVRLREAELDRFSSNTADLDSHLDDVSAILSSEANDLQGIISNTIPISPSQTITDALTARMAQTTDELDALPYTQQQQQLLDAVDVANVQYQELQGQELDLQHELRQLFTADAVGVVASGFAEATLSALSSAGLPSQLVSPWPSVGTFRGQPAPYYPPELAPRALVVPSGGLHAIANSPEARDWLAAYVASGGILIVFTQEFGADWTALPGGEVTGVGYEEDQRWEHATVQAGMPSDWLVWMGIDRPDIQVDGAFTAWPANANILLKRTLGSYAGYPAMIEYPYGTGTVLATSAYGDWAWEAGFWWGDDWQMTRSILNRAYLLTHGQDVSDAFTADPASTVTVSFPITNTGAITATSVDVVLPVRLGWWGNDYKATVPLSLAPGQSTNVVATLSTPPLMRGVHNWTQIGLYRLQATVHTVDKSAYAWTGPFVYIRSPVIPPALAVNLESEQTTVSLFQTVAVTATAHSYVGITRTIVISGQGSLPSGPITLTVPPRGSSGQAYTLLMDSSKNVGAEFYDESGKLLGRSSANINIAYPELYATPIISPPLSNGAVIPMVVTNRARQGQALVASLMLTLTAPSGATVWASTQALPPIAAGQTITPVFTLDTSALELGTYQLWYRVDDGRGLARASYVPLPSQVVMSATPSRDFSHTPDSGVVAVTLNNTGYFDLAPTVELSMTAPSGATVWALTRTVSIAAGQIMTPVFTFDALAAELGTYQLWYRVNDSRGLITPNHIPVVSQMRMTADLDRRSYRIRESGVVTVTLSNGGYLDLAPTLDLSAPDLGLNSSQPLSLPMDAGQTLAYTFTVPASLPAGSHPIQITSQVGSQIVSHTLTVVVPPSSINATLNVLDYLAGDTISVTLSNPGGVDAPVTTTLRLVDSRGQVIATSAAAPGVLAGGSAWVSLAIPADAVNGAYQLLLNGRNIATDTPFTLYRNLTVSGVAAGLSVWTGQPTYFNDESVQALANVGVASGSLENGNLNLRICSATSEGSTTLIGSAAISSARTITRSTYATLTVPYNWIDIASGGAVVAQGDDTYSLVDLGFPFQFYGVTYTQIYVGSNGYVSFGNGYTNYTNGPIPNPGTPNNAIYALWTDLYPVGGAYGSVYAGQTDATHYVVQWQGVSHCCSTGSPETFEIILDGSDNSITLQYLDVTNTSYATVGVEDAVGALALQLAYNQPGVIVDGSAFRLTPVEQTGQPVSYVTATVPLNWENIAPAAGTQVVAQGDNTYSLVDLGFPFQFYGMTYTQIYVGSNGYLSFDNGYTNYANGPIPDPNMPNNAIYALWTDLYPVGGAYGSVYARQTDATHYVVQWQGVSHCCSTGSPETFEIILDGSDNSITLQYRDVVLTGAATVGVEDAFGENAVQVAYNQPNIIGNEQAIKFVPREEAVPLPPNETVVSPAAISATIPAGQSAETPLTVTLGAHAVQRADVLILFDLTGSMGGVLSTAKSNAVNIMNRIRTMVPDSAFGVGSFADYPHCYNYAGYNNCYGSSGDFGWHQDHDITTDITAINSTINSLYLHSGSDWPEDYTRALYESQFASWRPEAKRIVIIFGDAPAHDTTFYLPYGYNFGVDPGRDEIAGTADDLVFTDVVSQLQASGITVLPIYASYTDPAALSGFQYMAAQTKGTAYDMGSTSNLPNVIGDAIGQATAHVNVMTLRADAPYDAWLAFAPPEFDNINAGDSVTFDPVRLSVPPGTAPGLYHFDLIVDGDGTVIATVPVSIQVPEQTDCGFVLWQTTIPVTATSTFSVSEAVNPLYVTGRLILDGQLSAATGQLLAQDDYPFYLFDRNVALTLETDRPVYRPGQSIQASGWVTNTSALTNTVALTLSDGTQTLLSQSLTLMPGQGYAYSKTFAATTSVTLTAAAQNVAASRVVWVAEPQVAAELIAPDVVGRTPFSTTLVLTNTGVVTASVQTTLIGQPGPTLALQPGEAVLIGQSAQITQDTVLTATVDGDVSLLLTKPVLQGERAMLSLQSPDVDAVGAIEVPYVLSGTGTLPASGQLLMQLDGSPVLTQPFAVLASQSISGRLPIVLRTVGHHTLTSQLVDNAGNLMSQAALDVVVEAPGLSLQSPDTDVAGLIQVPYMLSGAGTLPASGQLLIQLDGSEVLTQPFVVLADQSIASQLPPILFPPGHHTLTGQLVDNAGNLMNQVTLDLALKAPAQPAVPSVRLTSLSVSPVPAVAGGTLDVNLELANDGATGPIVVGLQLFDPKQQWIITPTGSLTQSFTFSLAVPPDVPSDQYFGQVTVDGRSQPFDVQVTGTNVKISLALDRPFYFMDDVARMTVTLTDTAGVSGDYIVMSRYLGAEGYYTVTVPANQTVQYTFAFTATQSGRVGVFLSNTPSPAMGQRVLMLDSLPVPVVAPDQNAYLTHDRLVYNPGDTVYMTVTVPGTVGNLTVMGPMELALVGGGALLWQPPSDPTGLGRAVTGTYQISYTLPAELRMGQYTFLLQADEQFYEYPVDVRGWKVTTRHMTLDKPRYAQADTITAVAEFENRGDEPINGLDLTAWVFTPDDGNVLELTPSVSRTVDLQPGLNVITVTGVFTTPVVGPHRLVVNVGKPGWRVAGAAAQFDVGWAHLVELNTDQGDYAPGEPGVGQLDVYGFGPTQMVVTATNGSTLFNTQADLSGFSTFTFTIPTTEIGNYLLVAQSVDQNGSTDNLIRAYAVPAPGDTQPPTLSLTYPNTATLVTTPDPTTTLMVTGRATDNSGQVTVLVNGQMVTPTASGDFSLPLEVQQGFNMVSAVALDGSGNIAYSSIIPVTVLPAHSVALVADRNQAQVGQPLTYTVLLTSSGTISDVVLVDLLPDGGRTNPVGSANVGQVSMNDLGVMTWSGDVLAGHPVTVTVQVTPLAAGTLTHTVTALWGYGLTDESNQVAVQVTSNVCDLSSIQSNFNGTAIGAGNSIWFNSVLKVSGLGSSPTTLRFTDVTLQFAANGASYTLTAPNSLIVFTPGATSATTVFSPTLNAWVTNVPSSYGGNVFLAGLAFQVPSGGLPGGINPVTWSGRFTTDTPSVTVNWQWAAAVYTQFNADYTQLGVKPVDDNNLSVYKNSDHAGTPENYKSYVIGGARGGGGSNYTGSYSGTGHATPCAN